MCPSRWVLGDLDCNSSVDGDDNRGWHGRPKVPHLWTHGARRSMTVNAALGHVFKVSNIINLPDGHVLAVHGCRHKRGVLRAVTVAPSGTMGKRSTPVRVFVADLFNVEEGHHS